MRQSPRSAALGRLGALVGSWRMEVSIGGRLMARGSTTFEWLDGANFVIQHADADPPGKQPPNLPPEWIENSPMPVTTIFGLDDRTQEFSMLYADARGVFRVYRMTLADGAWKIWGQSGPEFFQRFTAAFGDDGTTITGRWEASRDNSEWATDFDVVYTEIS